MTNNVDPDEAAHYEPPHQDLHCCKFSCFHHWHLKYHILKVLSAITFMFKVLSAIYENS